MRYTVGCAYELLTDGDGLADAVRRLTVDGVRFAFPIGERRFLAGLTVVAFAVANDENGLFVAADALEGVGDVGESNGIDGDVGDRSFNSSRVERIFLRGCGRAGFGRRNACFGRAGNVARNDCAGVCVGRASDICGACRGLFCCGTRKRCWLRLFAGALGDIVECGHGVVVTAGCQERGGEDCAGKS